MLEVARFANVLTGIIVASLVSSFLADNRGGRLNARHSGMLAGWRQVFAEAGGQVPDRNIEPMLRDTHVPVCPTDARRLDII